MKLTATSFDSAVAEHLVEASGEQIRAFLEFIAVPSPDSSYAQVKDWQKLIKDIPESIQQEAILIKEKPEAFSTEALVSYGEYYQQAIHHPVRIEVRRRENGDVTQIAARGVIGHFRKIALAEINNLEEIKNADVETRISGHGSFEANMVGVNKSLPIRYLTYKWEDILDAMDYQPGYQIDARQSRTLIAADGDGTTYAAPTIEGAPTLKESETYSALTSYLGAGGVYMVLSGNKLDRTAARMSDGLSHDLLKRIILVADGGALMGIFDHNGRLREVDAYAEGAREALTWQKARNRLDMIYLGDDGRKDGNDLDAFEEVGWDRSILVADLKTNDIIPSLEHRQIGGLTQGTRLVLDQINTLLAKRSASKSSFFTQDTIASLIKYAREVKC